MSRQVPGAGEQQGAYRTRLARSLHPLLPHIENLLLLVVAALLNVAIGAVFIPPATQARILLAQILGLAQIPGLAIAQDWPETFQVILWNIRLPHTALILLTGAALGGSGAVYQGVFRNPLADPYLIGVASGAGLGAVVAMAVHFPGSQNSPLSWLGLYLLPLSAFLGAVVTVVLVYSLARSGRGRDGAARSSTTNLILAGVAVSSFATSLTSLVMLGGNSDLRRALSWLMGGGVISGWEPVKVMLPYVALGLGAMVALGHSLNVMQAGDEQAQQLGLPVEQRRVLLLGAASLTTAAAVSFAGIIGFVGLIAPHIARFLWGPDYRRLVWLAALEGSSALLLADVLARSLLAPQVLPVGVVTALAGAPFFLWVMQRVRRQGSM